MCSNGVPLRDESANPRWPRTLLSSLARSPRSSCRRQPQLLAEGHLQAVGNPETRGGRVSIPRYMALSTETLRLQLA
jgi:hypothetical protein